MAQNDSVTHRDVVRTSVAAILAACSTFGILGLIQPVHGQKEENVNPDQVADADLVTLPSAHSTAVTIERVKALLAKNGIDLFAHVDHTEGARQAGMPLRPTELLIFGNPKAGTPLIQAQQTIGLDLPLRLVVWEDDSGKVWVTYRRVAALARHHKVTGREDAVKSLDDGLAALINAATT